MPFTAAGVNFVDTYAGLKWILSGSDVRTTRLNPDHVAALQEIRKSHSGRNISITDLDANVFVPRFCRSLGKMDRAVLFVDPYNTEFDWITLQTIARSRKVDLWLLFPLSVTLRMTPRAGARIKPEWRDTLTRLLGTPDWESALYKPKERPPIVDMFPDCEPDSLMERVNVEELQGWVTHRLRSEFAYVATPVTLRHQNTPLFTFYFAVSNPSKAAWGLAQKAANHIIERLD